MSRSIEKEVELLLKRQSRDIEKTPENELSLVERLEQELKKKKEEAKKALKEKEEAQAKKIGMEILKKYEVTNIEELESIIGSNNNSSSNILLDSSVVEELKSWVSKLNAWEENNWGGNQIDYKEFYPSANRLFKSIINNVGK